jgi:uncharacterized membrane protein
MKHFILSTNYRLRFLVISPIFIFLLVILVSAILAPYFETNLMVNQYQLIYLHLGKICHQFPTHSLYIFGSNMGLCSRCFSIYSILFLSAIFLIYFDIKLSWSYRCFVVVALIIPLLVDGLTQYYNIRESNNYIRVVTGTLAGLGSSILLISTYVTKTTNFLVHIFNIKKEKEGLIMRSKVIFSLFLIVLLMGSLAYAAEVMIKAGTPVPVRLIDDLSSETATAGQLVRFEATKNIMVDGIVVIKAGSEVIGEVSYCQKTGSLGKEGKINVVVRYATAVDNTRIPLRAQLAETGDEKVALSWMVCPFKR